MTIGAVLARLHEEFPDLTLSKVRFLDAQGLVSPERTPSGYRRYDERDVDRLRFVLTCQREKFWPLKVIREALDAYDRGLRPAAEPDGRPTAPAPAADPALDGVRAFETEPASEVRITPEELLRATGLHRDSLQDLESFGLLRAGPDGHFGGLDLQVAHAAASLLSYGVEARHLRPFRLAAEREVALVEGLSAGPNGSDREELVRQCLALHLALVRADLARE
nr:MerR family transcriptional regulator [Flexivirga meconopsidis]